MPGIRKPTMKDPDHILTEWKRIQQYNKMKLEHNKLKQHSAYSYWIDIIILIVILAIILLVMVACYYRGFSLVCYLYGLLTLYVKIIDHMTITCLMFQLMETIKNFIMRIWIKLKKNKIEYLGVVFQLSNIALSSPLLGGAQRWKASMVAGIAIFSILCYCGKVSVEVKRAKLTKTFFYPETRNNKKIWFFTARHVLEFLIPLSYTLLACVYLTELDTKNHHLENEWKSVAFSIQVFIHVIGGLLAVMNGRNPYYFRQTDQNQMIPMQPIDTIPCKGNEIILKDERVVAEELSEEVPDVNALEALKDERVVAEELSEEVPDVNALEAAQGYVENLSLAQGYLENQCADTNVSTKFAENDILDS